MNIVFFGSSDYVVPIVKVLKDNFNLALVATTEKNCGAVPSYCIANKIPYLSVSNLSDHNTKYKILNTKSAVAILADFGLIIPDSILNAFPKGIINLHPSLLPKYRGPTPVQAAILNGEKTTGISVMKIDNEIDHGPLLGSEKIEISDKDTSETLYKRAFEIGANLLLKYLPEYLNGNLKTIAQNHKNATFTKPLTRQSGFIDISKFEIRNSKFELERMIRAYFPWPGVWTKVKLNARPPATSTKQATAKPGDVAGEVGRGVEKIVKLLPEGKLQVEGKKPMSYKDFANGYPEGKEIIEKLTID